MVNKKTMTRAKEPIKIWAKPLKNGNKALYLRDTLPIPKAKGMSMRNWMACFLLMTRKVKIKVQKKETTKPCKLLHS